MNKLIMLIFIMIPFACAGQVKDTLVDPRDGKSYKTVKIGNEVWMAENIEYKTGNFGCWDLFRKPDKSLRYGYLYSYSAAKMACPPGWRLPSKNDFDALLVNSGNNPYTIYKVLQQKGENGFSILFAGYREENGGQVNVGHDAYLWSDSLLEFYNSGKGLTKEFWILKVDSRTKKAEMYRTPYLNSAYSIRCIKNQ